MKTHKRSIWFPVLLSFLAGAVVVWQLATEHVMRVFAVPAMLLAWGLLLALWWALGASSAVVKLLRVAVVGVVVVVLVLGIRNLVRYEGSASGSAPPAGSAT